MAALLRSARLLKFSPSGLVQITGTSRNGPPLGRLYSGTTAGRGLGVCPRQVVAPPGHSSASRCVWPYAGVRHYAGVAEPLGGSRDEPSVAVRSVQAEQFDWALAKLDGSVRRTGRITKTVLMRVFHDICRQGCPGGNQALLLFRSCGSLLAEMPLAERTELAHRIWDKLQELGVSYDASHYNALLKVYLQNEFKFSPTEFLAKMEAANAQPNRVTFQRLIAAYCQQGDIEGASTILGFMKSKDLPITEAVFNSLVTGHARAGDMESAENILPVMKGAGIEPGPDTYVALLNAYAEKGDMEKIRQTLQLVEDVDNSLMDKDYMQVIFTLAKSGHSQHVPEVVERMRHEWGFIPDAMNLCLSLITLGQEGTAFTVLKTLPTLQGDRLHTDTPDLGNFFLRHCVNIGTPVEKLAEFCRELQSSNLHTTALQFTLFCALESRKTGTALELMKVMKEDGLPVRPHYFWPLLIAHLKEKNTAGLMEVLRGMQELDVPADTETVARHIIPAFPSTGEALSALQELGFSGSEALQSEIRWEASRGNLGNVYEKLSEASFPAVQLCRAGAFRRNLIMGFKKTNDVESMAKITALLYKDERFSDRPAEDVGYLIYNLVDGLSETEVEAQGDKLRQYFHHLKSMNVTIHENIFKGIRNILSTHAPGLVKDVIALVDQDKPAVDQAPRPTGQDLEERVRVQERRLAETKAEGKPLSIQLKQLITSLCIEEKLDRALELKQQHEEEMVVEGYAALIQLCCRLDNLEEALNLKTELHRKDSSATLTANPYLALVKVLCKHGRVEEAVELLKEMKEKEVSLRDTNVSSLFHVLNFLAQSGDVATIRTIQDVSFTLGLVKPSANLCSPLIFAYLQNKDLEGALEAAMQCQKQYGQLPRIHDIIVALMNNGDTELLQKAMDFVSQERGEMTMLYDLFFAFMQTGRYREARKVIETPGLRARPGRLQWFAEKCIAGNQMETLENLVDMTRKLFECDRDEMYSHVLQLCKETNDWSKAEAVWTRMQEENVVPRERTLRLLADVLRANGKEVPFELPEVWQEQAAAMPQVDQAADMPTPSEYEGRVFALCRKGQAKEAFRMLMDAYRNGVAFSTISYNNLIKALLAEGNVPDAMLVKDIATNNHPSFHLSDVATNLLIISHSKNGQATDALAAFKGMLLANKAPSNLALSRLVTVLGSQGDVRGIQDVEDLMRGVTSRISPMVYVNNTALAHIKNGNVEAAVELVEEVYTRSEEQPSGMSFVFKTVLEDKNEQALDKLSAMVERLANQFASYRAATHLFLELVVADRVEDAKHMLERCSAISEQREALMAFMAGKTRRPGQVGKIKVLQSLIPDFVDKETIYAYLIKGYSVDGDLVQAKAVYEQMQAEGVSVDMLSLKRLAGLYSTAGETAPFPEPPESFRFYAEQLRNSKAQVQGAAEE